MNLSGIWSFYEEFGDGYDTGFALLKQVGNSITGALVFTEYIDYEKPFLIRIELDGEVYGDRLLLKGKSYDILEGDTAIHYCLDERIAELYDANIIEGHSVDEQELEGRFLLKRLLFRPN